MSTPEPEKRPFQFSLRSLLLFTLYVAVLCSIGVCTNWGVTILAVGGLAGRLVSRKWLGLVLGTIAGGIGAAMALVCLCFLAFAMHSDLLPSWQLYAAVVTTATIGSLLGGLLVGRVLRYRSER